MSSEPRYIPNVLLRAERLPGPHASWEEIERFALTFNGYTHCGSLEACAAVAKARRHETLSDLRTCLFYEQRSWRHCGWHPDAEAMAYIRHLIELIRRRVAAANELLA